MKKVKLFLFAGLMLFGGQVQAMRETFTSTFQSKEVDVNQPQSTSARIKSAFSGHTIPNALIDHVNGVTGNKMKDNQRTVVGGSSTIFKPVATEYKSGAKMSFDTSQSDAPKIIIDNPTLENVSQLEIIPSKANQGYAIKFVYHDETKPNEVVNYDANGKEIVASQAKTSSFAQSLQAMQKSVSDFFTGNKDRAAKLAAKLKGADKQSAENLLAKGAVDTAEENSGIQLKPLEKTQLWQATGQELARVLKTGLNAKTFYAWCYYPYDRITEIREARIGNTTTISRNAQDGSVVVRRQLKGLSTITQERYEYLKTNDGNNKFKLVQQDIADAQGNVVESKEVFEKDKIKATKYAVQDGKKVETVAIYKNIDMNTVIPENDTTNLDSKIITITALSGTKLTEQNLYYEQGKIILKNVTSYVPELKTVRTQLSKLLNKRTEKIKETTTIYYDGDISKPMIDEIREYIKPEDKKLISVKCYWKSDAEALFQIKQNRVDPRKGSVQPLSTYEISYGISTGQFLPIKIDISLNNILVATTQETIKTAVDGMLQDIFNGKKFNSITMSPEYKTFRDKIAQQIFEIKAKQLVFSKLKKVDSIDPLKMQKLPQDLELELFTGIVKIAAANS